VGGDSLERNIFRKGSATYYWSAKFFPASVREGVLRLYSFVRVADNYVDSVPQRKNAFLALRKSWDVAVGNSLFDVTHSLADTVDQRVIKNVVSLVRKHDVDIAWVEAFLDSMQADIDGKIYRTMDDTLTYIYGSAEVIGLMMARIMGLAPESYETARMLGRAMQYVNFIRDIDEDIKLGRNYFPTEQLASYGLIDLKPETATNNKTVFKTYVHAQIRQYEQWQKAAEVGYEYLPQRLRIPVKTAADMYKWTAVQIAHDPLVVYERKVKPGRARIFSAGLANIFC
jgi:phytoene synthase